MEQGDSGKHVSHVLGWVICVLSVTLLKLNMIMTPDSIENFNNFQSDNWKLMARIDWNIHQNHTVDSAF